MLKLPVFNGDDQGPSGVRALAGSGSGIALVSADLGLGVVEAFTMCRFGYASVFCTGEVWLGYVAENRLRKTLGQELALLAH